MYKRVVIGANMQPCVRVIALSTKGLVSGLVEWTIQVEMNCQFADLAQLAAQLSCKE